MPEVPGGAAVDVIAAVAFLLFVLSIVSSAVTELIASAFNWRGKMLRDAVGRLLGEDQAKALYASPRIRLLTGPRGRLPSYVPAAAIAGPEGAERFDELMGRLTGWYKRRVMWTLLAVALAGCVALNAEVFSLGDRFLKDEAIKQAVVAQSQETPATGDDPVAAAAQRVDAVDELELPFGWGAANRPSGTSEWLGKVLAWLVTAVSIPLGAAFWFDVLSRVSRLRATGRREGVREDETRRPVDRDDPGAAAGPS